MKMSSEGTLIKLREPMLYFDNVNITSVSQIESKSRSLENEIIKLKGKLTALALSTPKDITPEDYNNPIEFVTEQVNDLISEYSDVLYDSYTVNEIERLLDGWRYTYGDEPKDLYENCKTDEEVNKQAFPEDKHVEIKHDLNKFTFAPDDKTVDDTINRAINNINLNWQISAQMSDKVVILWNNHLFADYDGQFVFKNTDCAMKVLDKKLDLHTSEYISGEFIEKHPDFFPSILRKFDDPKYINYYPNNEKYVKENKEKFEKAYNHFIENDYKYDIESLDTLYNLSNSVIKTIIYDKCNIKIVRLYDLAYRYLHSKEEPINIDFNFLKNIKLKVEESK